jgi:hypothetical protein
MRPPALATAAALCLICASSTHAQLSLPADPSASGLYAGYYTNSGAPAYHWPVYVPQAYPYATAPAASAHWGYPGYYGGYRYTYNYYTHVPGVSYTHLHGGSIPRYYPSQWGGTGYYGYGPYPR